MSDNKKEATTPLLNGDHLNSPQEEQQENRHIEDAIQNLNENAEKESLLNPKPKKRKAKSGKRHNTRGTFCSLWLIFSTLVVLLFAICFICCFYLGVRLDGFTAKIQKIDTTLPPRYLIPQKRAIMPKNQQSRGSCWIFSTVGMIESSYRGYGVDHGLLNETEYVQFSEQAFGKLIFDYCEEHKEIPICNYGGLGINATSDGSVEFIYYLGDDAKTIVLPTSVCDYWPTRGEGEFHCNDENLAEIMKQSPIDFKITDIKTMYSVDEIKRTMVEKQSPISYGLATIVKGHYFPCNEQNPAVNDEVCTTCEFPCYQAASGQFIKDEIDNTTCCSRISLSSYSNDAIFELHGEIMGSGGHAMIIVGYNDEFRVDRDDVNYVEVKDDSINRDDLGNKHYNPVKGGFIIKNSWGTTAGHSMQYFLQNISDANEAILCPLTASVKNWGPVDIECLKEKGTYHECGFGRIRYVGLEKKRLLGGTKLQCSISSDKETQYNKSMLLGFSPCADEDANDYVYSFIGEETINEEDNEKTVNLKSDIPKDSDGHRIYYIAKMKLGADGKTVESVEEIKTNMTTLAMLEKVFKPMADNDVQNSEYCGYYFQPYDAISFLISDYKAWGYESYAFSYLEFDWNEKSYLKGHEEDPNYAFIKNSTVNYVFPEFDGPFGNLK